MVSTNFLGLAGNDDIQVSTALLQLAQQTAAAPLLTATLCCYMPSILKWAPEIV